MNSCQRLGLGLAAALVFSGGTVFGRDSFTRLVRSGDAVPDAPAGTTFSGVNIGGVDALGGTAFIGSFTISGTNYSGLYSWKNGNIAPLAGFGATGPAGETLRSIIATGDFENGVVVFAANTTSGAAMYRYTPGQPLAALVRQGDILPGSNSPVGTFFNRGVSGDATDFAFRTDRADSTPGLYMSVGGFGMQIADNNTRAGVAEMGNFVSFPELHYRNGATAFVGFGKDPDNDTLPPEPAGVFVARPGNPFEIVAARNSPIPNGHDDDERFTEFERPRILPDGRVGFAGGFINEEETLAGEPDHHMGVWIRNPDLTWKIYIDSDMGLAGLHAPIEEFNQYSVETDVNYFGVNDEDGGSYIYYESAEGVFTKLIDTYEQLDGKSMSQIRILSDTALPGGQLFFRANFTDGTTGIYTLTVPEPAAIGLLSLSLLALRRRH